MSKSSFTLFVYSLIGLLALIWMFFQIWEGKINVVNYLLAGLIMSIIPAFFSLMILYKTGPPTSTPLWYKNLVRIIPQPSLFIFALFLSILLSPAGLPIVDVFLKFPFGMIVALGLQLSLITMVKYESKNVLKCLLMKLIYLIYFLASFVLMIGPSVRVILTGQ